MPLKFLIVDDSKAMRTIVKRILSSAGYANHDFRFSSNGKDAIKQIIDWQPDMVLLDWHMPEVTGIQVLEKVKELNLDTKIGLITAEKNKISIKAAKDAGAIFVVNKPFTMEQLKECLIPALAGVAPIDEDGHFNSESLVFPSPSALSSILSTITGVKIKIRVIAKRALGDLSLPARLILYSNDNAQVKAIQVLDSVLCDRLAEAFCSSVYKNEAIDDKLLAKALLRALTIVAACFYDASQQKELNLSKTFTMQKLIDKVLVLDQLSDHNRLDLEFDFDGEETCYTSLYLNTNGEF